MYRRTPRQLQRSVRFLTAFMPMQAVTGEESQEAPMLWAVEALAEPIATRLRYHFASSSGSMNQPEHPEWLFRTALRYARGLAPAMEELQEIVAAHGLQGTYHLPFELARALRASVQVGCKLKHSCQPANSPFSLLSNDFVGICEAHAYMMSK